MRGSGTPMKGSSRARPLRAATITNNTARELLASTRSEEHTSELQSLRHLVCRLLLEKMISHILPHDLLGNHASLDKQAVPGSSIDVIPGKSVTESAAVFALEARAFLLVGLGRLVGRNGDTAHQ